MPPDPFGMPRIIDFLQAEFYSFRVDYDVNIHPWSASFNDYWWGGSWLHTHSVSPVPYILIAIFVLQISTLILGFRTLLMKPKMRFIPLISSVATASFMTWLYLALYMDGIYQRWNLAIGYWLTYASILCFSMSIILGHVFSFARASAHHNNRTWKRLLGTGSHADAHQN
jgi:hypothetical protein